MADEVANEASANPLSLQRLKAAFARMVTPGSGAADEASDRSAETAADDGSADDVADLHAILEGVLFVGGDGGKPRSAEELADALRDVTPEEVDQAVGELNRRYREDGAPFHIASLPTGYRLCLDDDLGRLRDKFHGRVRETRLTPATLEVLSVVAYRQPITAAAIDKLRDARSSSLLANLVRRELVRIDRTSGKRDGADLEGAGTPCYRTTDRFLKLFRLSDLDQLPRAAELE